MYPGKNKIYAGVIRSMVEQSLQRQELEFRQEHETAPDEVLLQYLRQCAAELGHSPHEKEIPGWQLLAERFGSWEQTLSAAQLPEPSTPKKPSRYKRIEEEYRIQRQIYRLRKQCRKEEPN